MMIALRYGENVGGYWDVRTEETIEQHTSLRRFQEWIAPEKRTALP